MGKKHVQHGQHDYFCSACEWTDRTDKSEVLTKCPICGGPVTELAAIEEENPLKGITPQKYDPAELKKVDEDVREIADL